MSPSDNRTKKSKKKNKEKKKSKKHKKHRKGSSSSSESDTGSDEWVEKADDQPVKPSESQSDSQKRPNDRDEWMTQPGLFPCFSRNDLRAQDEKRIARENEKKARQGLLDKPGQTERELNPYWKDGGTGLPENKVTQVVRPLHSVGDGGAHWLRKALQRAKEQAQEEGRSLEEVAAERWGSLEKLQEMLAEAEGEKTDRNRWERRPDNRRKYDDGDVREHQIGRSSHGMSGYFKRGVENYRDSDKRKTESRQARHENDQRQRHDSGSSASSADERVTPTFSKRSQEPHRKSTFSRPADSGDEEEARGSRRSGYSKLDEDPQNSRNQRSNEERSRKDWRRRHGSGSSPSGAEERVPRENSKPKYESSGKSVFSRPAYSDDESVSEKTLRNSGKSTKSHSTEPRSRLSGYPHSSTKSWRKPEFAEAERRQRKEEEMKENDKKTPDKPQFEEEVGRKVEEEEGESLTEKEMNELGAKIVKAEILGNTELAERLKKKLELARKPGHPAGQTRKDSQPREKEVVVLTRSDVRSGMTRPLPAPEYEEPSGGRRKKQKVDTHKGGQRVRYFPDDDKYNLKQMFEKEKMTTAEDQDFMFAKLAGKASARAEHDRDLDDVFSERAREGESEGRAQAREKDRAIREHKHMSRVLEGCHWCLDSKQMLKHLIVAVATKCYLCVPPHQSITEGHCLVVPISHVTCATQIDEDIWEEMQTFRRTLVEMFSRRDEDVVFYESAMYLRQLPHMVIECVPMPKETGDLAPIYFKKAILECEAEWSQNKKLVDLSGRSVRTAVPKGLPYFAVDFGMQPGFAHVIEDHKLFPSNFAQEIIGGMLDLEPQIWRKKHKENFDTQRKKVLKFSEMWKPFDWTYKLKKHNSSDSE